MEMSRFEQHMKETGFIFCLPQIISAHMDSASFAVLWKPQFEPFKRKITPYLVYYKHSVVLYRDDNVRSCKHTSVNAV